MKKFIACLLLCFFFKAQAQTFSRYVIQFRNKATTPYSLSNPIQYLSQRALDRRTRYGIALDSTDLPVTPRYIDSVRLAGAVTILNASRWLNSVSIQTSDVAALAKIRSFSFIQNVAAIGSRSIAGNGRLISKDAFKNVDTNVFRCFSRRKIKLVTKQPTGAKQYNHATKPRTPNAELKIQKTAADYFSYGQSYEQIHVHNGEFLHNIGLRGQGMVIGILDGGFYHYTTLKAFDSVNAAGQVLGTYDFVAGKTSVVDEDAHGMECFSIIAGNIPGQFVGAAPKASFYLYRSEDATTEYPVEEHNWVCAAERVDSVGGDLLSTSLGYTTFDNSTFDHTYADMNGNITVAARGADLAAKKGILVAAAAGNDGSNSWHYLSTPSDGDSVLAVGAVSRGGVVASFSSYGPSSDSQVKPDVASVGVATALQTPGNTIGTGNGTSFATPNMAGLATCLWQGFPEFNNMRIVVALRQAGSKAGTPDDRVGYGIPDIKKATLALLKDFSTATISAAACKNTVGFTSKDIGTMKYEIERKAPGETAFTKVGERQSTGTSFASRSYQFADSLLNVQAGVIAYRIREIIDTAAATFSADYIDTVTVNLAASCIVTAITPVLPAGEEVLLMPNPAKEKTTVKITTPYPIQNLVIRTMDARGATVLVLRKSKASGTASFDLPSYQLARGKYFVSIYNGEKLIVTKELIRL